ncbi:hypothetical protein Pelo_9029 [Pelomyxa schiedti]|nr:hypothetical protein Pelo_9029 [Pelomyxa schiedti]
MEFCSQCIHDITWGNGRVCCDPSRKHDQHDGREANAREWNPRVDHVGTDIKDRAETATKSTTASPNDVSRRTLHHRTRKVSGRDTMVEVHDDSTHQPRQGEEEEEVENPPPPPQTSTTTTTTAVTDQGRNAQGKDIIPDVYNEKGSFWSECVGLIRTRKRLEIEVNDQNALKMHGQVETGTGLCRGTTVFDWSQKTAPNVRIVTQMDRALYLKMVQLCLSGNPWSLTDL